MGFALVCIAASRFFWENTMLGMSEYFSIAFFYIAVGVIVFGALHFISGKLFEILHQMAPQNFILITKGDTNRFN